MTKEANIHNGEGGEKNGGVGRRGAYPLPQKHIKKKNTPMCGAILTENQLKTGRRYSIKPKPQEGSPCNWVG